MATASSDNLITATAASPAQPFLGGVLAGLRVLSAPDRATYKAAVEAGQQSGWAYYFPSLLTHNRPGRSAILIAEDAGSLCLFRWTSKLGTQRLELMLPPVPFDPRVLERCLERANDFNRNRAARILRIDEKEAGEIGRLAGLRISKHKEQFLFAPATYQDLSGRRLRTVRRNVQKVAALEGISVRTFEPGDLDACLALLRHWAARHRELHGTRGGVGTSRRALKIALALAAPDLYGELVFFGERLVAYAFGGEIRPGVGAFFDAKCLEEPAGLSFFHRYHFLAGQPQFEFINDGSDVGREGLRQLKNSLRPVGLHLEFRARQRADGDKS